MPRTLVTGGAGFLGSHLCEYLLNKGHEVIAMDNLITGSVDNIAHLRSEHFSFIKYDVTNYIYVEGPLDYVLHFASPASPLDYAEFPIQTLKVGSLGTHKALGLAMEKNATFLLASTSEVYGDPQVHPQPESYWGNVNPIGPRGVYDEAKRFAEENKFPISLWCTPFAPLLTKSNYIGYYSCRIYDIVDIDPSGRLLACDVTGIPITSLKNKSLIEALREYQKHPIIKSITNPPKLPKQCLKCELLNYCRGGCYARALFERGDLNAGDPLCPLIDSLNREPK